jgi:hypothetical protein
LQRLAREYQRAHVLAALKRYDGDRRRTAEALGISASTLKRRLRVCPEPLDDRSSTGSSQPEAQRIVRPNPKVPDAKGGSL